MLGIYSQKAVEAGYGSELWRAESGRIIEVTAVFVGAMDAEGYTREWLDATYMANVTEYVRLGVSPLDGRTTCVLGPCVKGNDAPKSGTTDPYETLPRPEGEPGAGSSNDIEDEKPQIKSLYEQMADRFGKKEPVAPVIITPPEREMKNPSNWDDPYGEDEDFDDEEELDEDFEEEDDWDDEEEWEEDEELDEEECDCCTLPQKSQ